MYAFCNVAVCCSLLLYCFTSVHTCPKSCRCSFDPVLQGQLVDCSHLALSELPGNIPEDTKIALFRRNEICHIKNFSFATLNKMIILDLSFNLIQILDEYAFQGLNSLMKLNLAGNCLVPVPDVYPERVFMPLWSLKELRLEYNRYFNCIKESISSGNSSVVNYFDKSINTNSVKRHCRLASKNISIKSTKTSSLKQNNGKINAHLSRTNVGLHRNAMEPVRGTIDYPDKALSYLKGLKHLSLDILDNKALGIGLRNLTLLTSLTFYCERFFHNLTTEKFVNVPHIENLAMHSCPIKVIDVNTFSMLENLTFVNMSGCTYSLDRLRVLFHSLTKTKIQVLDISETTERTFSAFTVTSNHLQYFSNLTSLQRLYARNNVIEGFEVGVICTALPKSLKEVYLDQNTLAFHWHYFEEFMCLENLELLSITNFNVLTDIFSQYKKSKQLRMKKREIFSPLDTHRNTGNSIKSIVVPLDTHRNTGNSIKSIVLPPKLKVLQATRSGLMSRLMSFYPFDPNNSLRVVYAGHNYFSFWGGFDGLQRLAELHLNDVSCGFIQEQFFTSLRYLEVLDISGNPIKEDIVRKDLFRNSWDLKNLSMSRIGIDVISHGIFRNLHKLEFLDLSANRIRTFEQNISHMVNLTFLNLSVNQLNTLPKPVRSHLDSVSEKHLVTVDLTFNPIACVCENIEFLKWMTDSKVTFGRYTDYTCVHESEGLPKQTEDIFGTIARLERECNSYAGMFFGAAVSCLVVLIILGTALAYRFRWKLRYLYYATRLNFKRQNFSEIEEFQFDAFVSFSSEDANFVVGEMKTRLEDEMGIKLCIHVRDFTPGQYIASNILDAIQRSRHTMVVLTRALLESDWCNYELQMALMEGAQTGRDVLLFLLYEDIPNSELPREIIFNIQSHTYLEFPHTEVDRELFWNRLTEALRG